MRRLCFALFAGIALAAGACQPQTPAGTNTAPVAAVSAVPSAGTAPLSVAFSSAGSHDNVSIASYSWNFGDGSPLVTTQNPTHVYTSAGTYTAKLTVKDGPGLTGSATQLITVVPAANQAPHAVIGATPDHGKAPLDVAFDSSGSNDPDGTIASVSWNFGDGSGLDTTANPTHTFSTVGTFITTLTVTDNAGSTNTAATTITTVANVAPTAGATATPDHGKAPLSVAFSSATSTDSDGTIASYSWDFADGSPVDHSANPTHVFAAHGTYPVTLTVTDDSGDSDTTTVTVVASANVPPTAVANATPPAGKAPLTVALSSVGSTDADGTVTGYSWDFGDGSPLDTTANPSHVYAAEGPYTATLTVTDDSGDTDSASVAVNVGPTNVAPVAAAAATPASGKAPLSVALSSAGSSDSDGSIVSYSWDFGDGSPLDGTANPTHVYAAGSHTATLTVTDDDGASSTATAAIVAAANVAPTAHAAATPASGKAPLSVALSSAGSSDSDGSIASYSWDFGDGSPLDGTANPTHVYAAGTHTATLTVTDDNGATDSTTVTVTANANVSPTAVANADIGAGDAPLAVHFDGSTSDDPDGTIVSYSWDFGDGSPLDATASPAHTYLTDGTFSAVLTVTDDNGATGTAVQTIVVSPNQPPVAAAAATPASGKAPLSVALSSAGSADPDGSIVSYSWDFGDGSPLDTTANPSHTYTSVGSFVASVTVTDNGGLTAIDSATVTTVANVAPTAGASATPTSGKSPLSVAFSSATSSDSDGTIVSYNWDFGDGSPFDHSANPTHVYATGGHTATLTVTDDNGATDSTTVAVTANANQPPVAVANATPDNGIAPVSVDFSSAGSVDNDGTIASYSWDFGDGSPLDATANPTHVYTVAGTRTATLTVTDDSGDADSASVVVTVGAPNQPPTLSPLGAPSSGKAPLVVNFTSSASDADGSIASYHWDFGDGSPVDTTANPVHTYTDPGAYTATITVTDDDGATATATVPVTANANVPPIAAGYATPSSGKAPLTVVFTSSSTDVDGSLTYSWNFGDGSPVDTSANPSHTYTDPGSYTATLTVTDDNGATDSTTVAVTANANVAPTAFATATPSSGNAPLMVALSSSGSTDVDGTITYSWNFGDGSPVDTSANPSHTYTNPGSYTATLTVTDDNGATATATAGVTVNDPVIYVSTTGNDGAAGTKAAPKATIAAGLTAAQSAGFSAVRVAGGSYTSFTAASGISVTGGYDQSFVSGGGNGATTVTVTGSGAGIPAVTVTGATVSTTLKSLTLKGGAGGTTTGVLAQTNSIVVLDSDTISSGVPSGAGASAYGVRVLSGSSVTVTGGSITASPGVAGTAGTNQTGSAANGAAGAGGAVGADYGNPSVRSVGGTGSGTGGAGGGGGLGGNNGTTTSSGCSCIGANALTTLPGLVGTQVSGGGAGGAGGVVPVYIDAYGGRGGNFGSAGTAGTAGGNGAAGNNTAAYGASFSAGGGGAGAAGGNGGGGGAGSGGGEGCAGSGCTGDWYSGGGGGAGGQGGSGGAAGGGGTGGGGSFGVYANNASVTVSATSSITTGAGGAGGTGGTSQAGGTGGAGGIGGAGNGSNGTNGTAGAAGGAGLNGAVGGNGAKKTCFVVLSCGGSGGGGGGGGGGAGAAGGKGGGGAGGSSVGVLHSGSGSATSTGASMTIGSAGTGGAIASGNAGVNGDSASTKNV